jgi:GT2 family glycosyltransferase
MSDLIEISASIVCYNQELETLQKTVDSFLKTPLKKKLFLIDNSTINELQNHFNSDEIEYIFIGKNLGFGKAHNLILDKITADFHLILNPDVVFDTDVIPALITQLNAESDVSFITPKVLNSNGQMQFVCRKYPTFFDLINRKLRLSQKTLYNNEYRNYDLEKPFYPEFIHGCFMFFKTTDFKTLNGFDTRYFLYLEDADICRKIDKDGKKILYFPSVQITHQHQKGSSKSVKLFLYHFSSAIKYFLKWGF